MISGLSAGDSGREKTGVMSVMSGRWLVRLNDYYYYYYNEVYTTDLRSSRAGRVCHENIAVLQRHPMQLHLILDRTVEVKNSKSYSGLRDPIYQH